MKHLRLTDLLAILLSIFAFGASLWTAQSVYDGLPHIEDEMAYTWQARVIAESMRISVPTPVCPRCFLQPFVVDYHGQRFGKYPPGWPAALAVGEMLGARGLVNPFLAAFSIWLIYLLGKRLIDPATGLLAALLTTLSPFFWMNSGSLLAHPWSLFLTLAFTHAWLDAFNTESHLPRSLTVSAAGLSLGALALTRPFTALVVAVPFAAHGIILLAYGDRRLRLRLLAFGLIAAALSSLVLLWQYAVTGNALLNPYTLWWPYDRIGFGPGIGAAPGGHTPHLAWVSTKFSLFVGEQDLFGWPYLSYLFLPFGLIALRRSPRAWLAAAVPFCLTAAYTLYWIGSWLYGPRYYYEGLAGAALLSAAGMRWLAGRATGPLKAARWGWLSRIRLTLVTLVCALLMTGSALYYLPMRLNTMHGLYNVSKEYLQPFLTPQARALPPTLVIVHAQQTWIDYGRLTDLSSPLFTSQFIFTISRGDTLDKQVIAAFPERLVWHYTPGQPVQMPTP